MKRKLLYSLLIALIVVGGYLFYEYTFNHFKLEYIAYNGEISHSWNFDPIEFEAQRSLFARPFHYLGEGHQSYAFLSEDGKYVLKFFKFKKARKMDRIFRGYGLAYKYDRANCGLHYVHLTPTNNLNQKAIVKDRIGRAHKIDLDQVIFVIQEKAEQTREVLGHHLSKNELIEAKKCIQQILDLYVAEYKMGLFDADHNVMHNSGFVGGKFIRTDVGKLIYDPAYSQSDKMMEDLNKIAWERIDLWVAKYFPQFRHEIRQSLFNKLEEIQTSL